MMSMSIIESRAAGRGKKISRRWYDRKIRLVADGNSTLHDLAGYLLSRLFGEISDLLAAKTRVHARFGFRVFTRSVALSTGMSTSVSI